MPLGSHANEVALLRLAEEGIAAGDVHVIAHVRECRECADIVRYARAVRSALGQLPASEGLPSELLMRVMQVVRERRTDVRATNNELPGDK